MSEYLFENAGTIVVSTVLLCVVCFIVFKLARNKKKGKSACGCNCTHCAMSGMCHK